MGKGIQEFFFLGPWGDCLALSASRAVWRADPFGAWGRLAPEASASGNWGVEGLRGFRVRRVLGLFGCGVRFYCSSLPVGPYTGLRLKHDLGLSTVLA